MDMHLAHIDIHLKPEFIDQFIEATIENARNSLHEPGILRFDFAQALDDPAHFMLYEVYRSADDVDKHRETTHYQTWRDTVADMMAVPRVGTKYRNIYPRDDNW
jgi:(4S)-4-hydroxy-5-phosphonooxypentane-2,3-dione isomerase